MDEGEKSRAMDGCWQRKRGAPWSRICQVSYVRMGLAAEMFSVWMGLRVLREPDGARFCKSGTGDVRARGLFLHLKRAWRTMFWLVVEMEGHVIMLVILDECSSVKKEKEIKHFL